MSTNSYIDVCDICGGNANMNQSTRPIYTSSECYDCGWWETDQEGYEGSGFMTLDEINNLREMVDMDELSHEELVATQIRINGPIPPPTEVGATYEYASVINRVVLS